MKVYLLLMLLAMGITVLVTPIVRFACLHWGIVPKLRSRDIQSIPIPRLGGIAMTTGFVIAMLIASTIPYMAPVFSTSVPWAVMGGAAAMSLLGVIDDVIELDWMTKLSGQILITGLMALSGVQLVSFPIFGITIGSSRLSLILTLLVVVAIINAVNFIDGLDGLAAGTVGIGAMSFFIYSYSVSVISDAATYATTASLVVIALVGVCAGFLWFNFHPSSIMMGGGAETLGLILASAAIIVTGQIDPSVLGEQRVLVGLLPVLLPLSVIVVPMGDLVATSLIRMKNGKSPFHADRSHFHDRLLARGHTHRGVVTILWLWTAQVSLSAVSLLNFPWHYVALVSVPTLVLVLIFTVAEFPWMREAARKAATHGKDEDDRHSCE